MGTRFRPLVVAVVGVVAAIVLLLVLLDSRDGLDRTELIRAGDAICGENNDRLREISKTEEGIPLSRTKRAVRAIERLNGPGLDTTRRLAALEPASDVRDDFERLIALRRRRDEGEARVLAELRREDPQAAAEAQRETVELSQGPIRETAESIGFQVCGQPLPP